MSLITDHKEKLCNVFKKEGLKISVNEIEEPKNKEHGDLAVPCFIFSKELKKSPAIIAQELKDKLNIGKNFTAVNAVGPYLNFFIDVKNISKTLLKQINSKGEKFAEKKTKKPQKVMVEFCSPNTNKPLHLGHLRNMFLGESISSVLKYNGDNVVKSCLVNDRGVHICKSMLAYKLWGKNQNPKKLKIKGDHFVGDYYVKFSEHQDKELDSMVAEMLQKWEQGDKETIDLWQNMNKWVLEGFEETYKKIGVAFDKYYYESNMYDKGKDIIMTAYEDGKFIKKEGAIVAQLEEYGLPDKVLIRSDGTTIYMTQDIYLAIKKITDYNLDSSIYVVGSEQDLHFKQLFRILNILGYSQADKCYHMSYGMVNLPDGKMKSREGTVVDADDLIDNLFKMALEEVYSRDASLSKKVASERAMKIALSGLKFYLLKQDPVKEMTYNPKASISFEGETGPYVQYTIVRISSIIEKSKLVLTDKIDFDRFEDSELNLVSMLMRYEDILESAYNKMRPNLIANYLIELSQSFNAYYHNTKIINTGMEKERLYLINAISIVLSSGLSLLGIDVPDKM